MCQSCGVISLVDESIIPVVSRDMSLRGGKSSQGSP